MITDQNILQMKLAFPGQAITVQESYIAVARSEENEALLRRRGYFYEVRKDSLEVYFPSEEWLR